MSPKWQKAFEELEAFISDHKDIEIDADVVCLPGEVRVEFYRLFDAVRTGFVKERFPCYIEEAAELSRHFLGVKQRLCSRLGLEGIDVSPHLNWFINDPVNALGRVLFDPLFDVLKRKIDLSRFETMVDSSIKNAYGLLFREAAFDGAERSPVTGAVLDMNASLILLQISNVLGTFSPFRHSENSR